MIMVKGASSTAKLRRLHRVCKSSLRGTMDVGYGRDIRPSWPITHRGPFQPLPDNLELVYD